MSQLDFNASCDGCGDHHPQPSPNHANPHCPIEIQTCCRVQIPKGFRLADNTVNVCIDYSALTAIKSVLCQQVTIDDLPPNCTPNKLTCNAQVGYVVRAVGGLNLAVSVPIQPVSPNTAKCMGTPQACCSQTVPVNRIIAYTCWPNPCQDGRFDVSFTANRTTVNDACGTFVLVQILIRLNYIETCA